MKYIGKIGSVQILHFENIEAKHATELISFEIQCFDSTFVDKLFKSVLKSLRFEKHDFCPSG
jgi:hypothetical protein